MELKNQVCTLKQSKRIAQLATLAGAALQYMSYMRNGKEHWVFEDNFPDSFPIHQTLPAYTVAELGLMLSLAPEDWNYQDKFEPRGIAQIFSAEWLGRVVIYLLENKLITPEQVNASLTQQ